MITHKKILIKFNELEAKYFNHKKFEISKNQLHNLILNKKFNFIKFTITGFLANSILIFLSLISIFFCKLKKIKLANYFIVHPGQKGAFDFRSKYILQNYNFNKSLNIIRCASFFDSLKAYILFPNAIFYLSFDYFNNSFFYKKSSLKNNYKILHEKEKKNYKTVKKIFSFLNIRKFLSIDDQRIIQVFLKVCKEMNIKTYGYMHYKFSKYVIGIKYLCFDHFFLWSYYFKKKLIEVNKKYKNKKIFISGFNKKKISKKIEKNIINVLYIIDLNLSFKITSKFLKKLNKQKNINLYIKLKAQNFDEKWANFFQKEKINFFTHESLDEVNKLVKFDYFIGTISTALLEATLYESMPIKIISKNDFADDLIQDKVVIKAKNFNDLKKILKKKPKKNEVSKIFKKVWGSKKYKSNYINKILSNYFYEVAK